MSIFTDIVLLYLVIYMTEYCIVKCFIVLSEIYFIVYVSKRIIASYETI